MVSRFIALGSLSDEQRSAAIERVHRAAPGMRIVLRSPDLLVMSMQQDGLAHLAENAVAVGAVFSMQSVASNFDYARDDALHQILTRIWGSYVAFLPARHGHGYTVLRDPSGAMPCYYMETKSGLIFSSDVGLLLDVAEARPEISWRDLEYHLAAARFFGERTCLAGIREVIRGHALRCRGGEVELIYAWRPWDFVSKPRVQTFDDAVATVRRTTLSCAHAWSSRYRHALVSLSGGLDSSIVVACLAQTDIRLSCLTLATADATGDEREYARAVTNCFGLELSEAPYDPNAVDITLTCSNELPRPISRPAGQAARLKYRKIIDDLGVDVMFDGGGGDSTFCALSSLAPIADRLLRPYAWSGLWLTINDLHKMSRVSVWEILIRGIRRAWFRPPDYPWPLDLTFLRGKSCPSSGFLGQQAA
jgi:asparagine synthase (glutamine-hydrolysing)